MPNGQTRLGPSGSGRRTTAPVPTGRKPTGRRRARRWVGPLPPGPRQPGRPRPARKHRSQRTPALTPPPSMRKAACACPS
jgi:hypothetical protein